MREADCMVHVVKERETLYMIAQQYGVKATSVIFANPYADVYNLRPGDELCIPGIRKYS